MVGSRGKNTGHFMIIILSFDKHNVITYLLQYFINKNVLITL